MSELNGIAKVLKTVNRAKDLLLDVKRSREDAAESSVLLRSNTKMPVIKEDSDYRAEKELNLLSFKLLLQKFMVNSVILILGNL